MTDDVQLLRGAAERALTVLPQSVAQLVTDELERGIRGLAVDAFLTARCPDYLNLARAVLAMAVADAATRDTVGRALHDAHRALPDEFDTTEDYWRALADALITQGLIRQPVTAEQIEAGAKTLADRDDSDCFAPENDQWSEDRLRRDDYRGRTRGVLHAAGIEVGADD